MKEILECIYIQHMWGHTQLKYGGFVHNIHLKQKKGKGYGVQCPPGHHHTFFNAAVRLPLSLWLSLFSISLSLFLFCSHVKNEAWNCCDGLRNCFLETMLLNSWALSFLSMDWAGNSLVIQCVCLKHIHLEGEKNLKALKAKRKTKAAKAADVESRNKIWEVSRDIFEEKS